MKDSQGRGVIRLGDTTSHGGTVISASTTLSVLGQQVACDGDDVFCPRCKGVFKITVVTSDRSHCGKRVAYHGDKTACGAALVSSR
jgi:uncharacterized Zn-binding protein involved in type VI secretion